MKNYETSKGFKVQEYDDTLSVTDCITKRGYYRFLVYDTTRGMNIGTSDENEVEALFSALKYYQKRLTYVEQELNILNGKVNSFLSQFQEESEGENE
jgi:hypothetical protein